jgi:hypothetical protein
MPLTRIGPLPDETASPRSTKSIKRRGKVNDFSIVNVPLFLGLKVTTYDADGKIAPDDGEIQRHGAETQYVLAEFLCDKELLLAGVDTSRCPDLIIKFSSLTPQGKAFARFAVHKWLASVDRAGRAKPVDAAGLERRWRKFIASETVSQQSEAHAIASGANPE